MARPFQACCANRDDYRDIDEHIGLDIDVDEQKKNTNGTSTINTHKHMHTHMIHRTGAKEANVTYAGRCI